MNRKFLFKQRKEFFNFQEDLKAKYNQFKRTYTKRSE